MKLHLIPLLVLALAGVSWAQENVHLRLEAAFPGVLDPSSLGQEVAIWGDLGAATDARGRVHVFVEDQGTWSLLQTIQGPTNQAFGSAIDIVDNLLAIGASGTRAGYGAQGSVFLYRRGSDGLFEATEIVRAPAGEPGDEFGAALKLSGNRLFVGAPGASAGAGQAFYFLEVGGTYEYQSTLVAFDGAPDDGFGFSISAYLDVVAVGAPWDGPFGQHFGAVYLFRDNGTAITADGKLSPQGNVADAAFGFSVDTDGERVVGGAPGGKVGIFVSGTAYVYARNGGTWVQGNTLQALVPRRTDRFGSAVSISDGVIAVGALGDDNPPLFGTGSVTMFVEGNPNVWAPDDVQGNEFVAADSYLGASVDMHDGRLITGAPGTDAGAGAAFLFAARQLQGNIGCSQSAAHSGGSVGSLRGYGDAELSASDFEIFAYDLPPQVFCVSLVGTSQSITPGFMGSQGDLCLGMPLGIFRTQVGSSSADGMFWTDVSTWNLPVFGMATAGSTYHFQTWFRDSQPGPTTNFTNSIAVQVQ